MSTKNEMLIRVYIVVAAFVLFAVLILGRVIKISLSEGDKWREKSGKNVKLKEINGDRGNIYDINGNLLATSLPYFDVKMDLLVAKQSLFDAKVDSLSYLLSKHLGQKSALSWKSDLISARKAKNRYYHIISNVSTDKVELLRTFPILRKGKYGGGLILERETKRGKPFKSLASRTIGIDRAEDKIGLEGSFDTYLQGPSINRLMKRLRGGVWVPVVDPSEQTIRKGSDLVTTLDMRMQDIVDEELDKTLMEHEAKAGTAILMDVETGAIKAISNLEQTGKGYYEELYNHAIGTRSEPGSTFKLPSVLMLLEDSLMTIEDKVDLRGGKRKFHDIWMYDSDMHGERSVSLEEAFKISSNVGIASAIYEYYGKKRDWIAFAENLKDFGCYDITGIEIVGEKKPVIKDPKTSKSWWGTTVPWMAHGYEMMQTPLQTLNFYNAVANNGKLMKPYIVQEIINENGAVKKFTPQILKERIAQQGNIDKCKYLLEQVVLDGTGKRIKSDVVSFAGKTGTTRVNYNKSDEVKKYNASFVGYFPAEKPKYSLIVMVYEPKHGFYGAQSAGPAFKNIVERVYSMKEEYLKEAHLDTMITDVAMDSRHSGFGEDYEKLMSYIGMDVSKRNGSRWVDMEAEGSQVSFDKMKIKKRVVPDVRGMGLRDATYVLENLGMEVDVSGVGKVLKQSVSPGANINGQKIEIYLN